MGKRFIYIRPLRCDASFLNVAKLKQSNHLRRHGRCSKNKPIGSHSCHSFRHRACDAPCCPVRPRRPTHLPRVLCIGCWHHPLQVGPGLQEVWRRHLMEVLFLSVRIISANARTQTLTNTRMHTIRQARALGTRHTLRPCMHWRTRTNTRTDNFHDTLART